MPEISFLQAVYGKTNRYRIANSEAPRTYGFNIVRLVPDQGATEITVNLEGLHEAKLHSDWRACIVAVDANGRARYSQLWNKGKLDFTLRPSDKHLWLTVAATPSALPRSPEGNCDVLLAGIHAPRYPWEVTLSGCKPGTPHRRQGDVINFDELYTLNNGNQYLGFSVKNEVPIPLTDVDGPLAQDKLADMSRRISIAAIGQNEKVESGEYDPSNWWESAKLRVTKDLNRRVKFLQTNAKGHRHANGGGFVADSAHVAATAYVGPQAMVLDGARVEDNACIQQYAVVHGPKTVIRGNAKIGGKAWVFGDITVGGNARILESVIVTTVAWARVGRNFDTVPDGRAEIDGNVVLKGEHILRLFSAKNQKLTGEFVMDYTPGYNGTVGYYELVPGIVNLQNGVFKQGRIYGKQGLGDGADAGGLYANWQFDHPHTNLLEDSYINNNGVLHGRPEFVTAGETKCIVFNGKDQYVEAPPSVADFAELTIDMRVNRSGSKGGRLFDFGTGEDECFYLEIDGGSGKPRLTAQHDGKTYRVAASQAIPVDTWSRVRIELDGSNASIYVDGKRVANGEFEFRRCDVFLGDRAEGNFIACGRNQDQFFQGRMDHFRIYREVHDDFDELAPIPFALTQLLEWSEQDQKRADTWETLRKATVAERNGDAKLDLLYARVKEIATQKRTLDQKIRNEFKDLPSTVKAEQEIKELRSKTNALMALIREDNEYTKLAESIRVSEQQRRAIQKAELPNQVGLAKKNSELQRLKLNQSDLIARLKATRPKLSKLEKLVRAKQEALNTARKRHEEKQRGQDEYIQITEAYAATNQALGDEKKRLLESAGVSGRNPFARRDVAQLREFQQSLKYHTTADWDHRTREEVSGAVPPKMKNWLLRVRGF
jgi:hypothetical protein